MTTCYAIHITWSQSGLSFSCPKGQKEERIKEQGRLDWRSLKFFVYLTQDLIHGAPIGKAVSSTAMVTAVYAEEDGTEINFTRKYVIYA